MAPSASLAFHSTSSDGYSIRAGRASTRLGTSMLKGITPAITSDSYILDNACGPAIVTEIIKEQSPVAKIMCADFTQGMLDQVKAKTESNGWTDVETQLADMMDLKDFKDNTFSHSFTCLGIQALGHAKASNGPLKACKELYRVSKVGGVASISTWSARRVRPNEEPVNGMAIPEGWDTGSWLMRQLEEAGFGAMVRVEPCPIYAEYESLQFYVDQMMSFKAFFFAGYSDEEIALAREKLGEEFLKMKEFEVLESGRVRLNSLALVAYAWK